MDSDNILLITFMIQNCFRERRGTSEAEFKEELVLHKAWERVAGCLGLDF